MLHVTLLCHLYQRRRATFHVVVCFKRTLKTELFDIMTLPTVNVYSLQSLCAPVICLRHIGAI